MLIKQNRDEIIDEDIFEDGQDMTDLEKERIYSTFYAARKQSILTNIKSYLIAQDRLQYSEMMAEFEPGVMPIAGTFVLALVLNVESANEKHIAVWI